MIFIKKFFTIVCFLFILLTGCSEKFNINYVIKKDEGNVYAYNKTTCEIELVYADYEINDYKDVFNLYTKYSNNLPCGYISGGCGTVSLIDAYLVNNDVIYNIDEYYCLIPDFGLFSRLITKSNQLLGFNNTYIYYKNKIIS